MTEIPHTSPEGISKNDFHQLIVDKLVELGVITEDQSTQYSWDTKALMVAIKPLFTREYEKHLRSQWVDEAFLRYIRSSIEVKSDEELWKLAWEVLAEMHNKSS